MSNFKLEGARYLHSQIELCKEQMHEDLVTPIKGHKEQILQDHRMKLRVDMIVNNAKQLVTYYEDNDRKLKEEINEMKGRSYMNVYYSKLSEIRRNHEHNLNIPIPLEQINIEPKVEFSGEEWFGRFVDMNTLYYKYINLKVFQDISRIKKMNNNDTTIKNEKEKNLKNTLNEEMIDYKTFLIQLQEFWRINNAKKDSSYQKFYQEVLDYLISFWSRTHPLAPTKTILKRSEEYFTQEWNEDRVEGWQIPWKRKTKDKYDIRRKIKESLKKLEEQENNDDNKKKKKNKNDKKDDGNMKDENNKKSDKEEMEDDDDDDSKMITNDNENTSNNTGTIIGPMPIVVPNGNDASVNKLQMKVNKMEIDDNDKNDDRNNENEDSDNDHDNSDNDNDVDNENENDEEIIARERLLLYCRACDKKFSNQNTLQYHKQSSKHNKQKNIASLEYKITLFCELLQDNIEGAIEYIEKKQTKTYEELIREFEDFENSENENEDDNENEKNKKMYENPAISNPLDIPLDFDGKPIPYWLYKFRGLNRWFVCQICGDQKYRGPRAFERHFREWRHAHSMRRLGIPNTKDFHMITKIQDALNLNEKIKQDKRKQNFNADDEEEYEDNDGNVFKKSTFEQLKRQGVI